MPEVFNGENKNLFSSIQNVNDEKPEVDALSRHWYLRPFIKDVENIGR